MLFKVCGITREQDADGAIAAGATHLGLIVAPGSPRRLETERAATLRRHIGARAAVVGVFRKQPVDEVVRLAHALDLAAIQLHGGFPPEAVATIRSASECPILWAVPVSSEGAWIDPFAGHEERPDFYLLDTSRAGVFGGTGSAFEWSKARRPDRPFFVAGGLGNHNAIDAWRALKPDGLDFNSKLETAPGEKSAAALRELSGTIGQLVAFHENPMETS